jgi:DNA-binding response OmpR family regulator
MTDGVIFVVEDDRKTAAAIRLYLEHEGFAVECAHDGSEALDRLHHLRPLAVILDLMLPGLSGTEICKAIRRDGSIPVLMVSARTEEPDRYEGLSLGADDYITKPFSPRELVARVKAVLRRVEGAAGKPSGICLDTERHALDLRGTVVPLSPTEFRIVDLFIRSPQRTFTRDEVIRFALGPDFDGLDRTIDAHIMNIRRKVRAAGGPARILRTVFGVGYRLESSE